MCFRFLSRNCKYKKWDLYLSSEQYTSCVISDNLSHTCPSQGTEGERCEWWSEDRETACSVLRCTIISVLSKQTRKQNKNMCFSSLCSKSGWWATEGVGESWNHKNGGFGHSSTVHVHKPHSCRSTKVKEVLLWLKGERKPHSCHSTKVKEVLLQLKGERNNNYEIYFECKPLT